MRTKVIATEPLIAEDASGIVLGINITTADASRLTCVVSTEFMSRARQLAHRFGLGITYMSFSDKIDTPFGAFLHGRDDDGNVRGALRAFCKEFNQNVALYRTGESASWQLLNFREGRREHSAIEIGQYHIESLATLVSILLGQQDGGDVNPASHPSRTIATNGAGNVALLEEPGWLGRWRLSLVTKRL